MQRYLWSAPQAEGRIDTTRGPLDWSVSVLPESEAALDILTDFIRTSQHTFDDLERAEAIWIKPNVTGPEIPSRGRTTQPHILEAVILAFHAVCGKRKAIVVADSSVIGCSTHEAAHAAGIVAVCERHDVPFVDLREANHIAIPVKSPMRIAELHVAEPFAKQSVFKVNLAKLKSTYGSPVGFCVKNSKGVITDEDKLLFHLRGLQYCLCDLARAISWDLSILEGFPLSELGVPGGSGPFVVSSNAVLTDALAVVCSAIPWKDTGHIEHLSKDLGLTYEDLTNMRGLDTVQRSWPALAFSHAGVQDLARKYGVLITDGAPCTACTESLSKALARLRRLAASPSTVHIVMGANARISQGTLCSSEEASTPTIFLGNCSFDAAAMDLVETAFSSCTWDSWQHGMKIAGCPPTIDSMFAGLQQRIPSPSQQMVADGRAYSGAVEDSFCTRPIVSWMAGRIALGIIDEVPKESVQFDDLGREACLAAEVVCAAICHQIRWEFLRHALSATFRSGADWWYPENVGGVDRGMIERLLSGYGKPERIRARQRAQMIRSLAALFSKGASSYREALGDGSPEEEQRSVLRKNLLRCTAFAEDPEQKKFQVLVHRLADAGLVPGVESLCRPAVDYHIMRLYLRRGDVGPANSFGEQYIHGEAQRHAATVSALRRLIGSALVNTATAAGQPLHRVNTVEWWIGRSVCVKNGPDCDLQKPRSVWARAKYTECPYARFCLARVADPTLLIVQEPRHQGKYY